MGFMFTFIFLMTNVWSESSECVCVGLVWSVGRFTCSQSRRLCYCRFTHTAKYTMCHTHTHSPLWCDSLYSFNKYISHDDVKLILYKIIQCGQHTSSAIKLLKDDRALLSFILFYNWNDLTFYHKYTFLAGNQLIWLPWVFNILTNIALTN